MTPILTHLISQSPPPVDASDALDSTLLGAREDASDAARLASVGYLPGECLTAADDNIFGVNQDWVHHNPGTHLDVGIEENGNCQQGWKY